MGMIYSDFWIAHVPEERNKRGLNEEVQALTAPVKCIFLKESKLMWKYKTSLKSC